MDSLKILNKDGQFLDRDFNPGHLEYEASVLTIQHNVRWYDIICKKTRNCTFAYGFVWAWNLVSHT
jgi:hypothetical protein